MDLISPEQRDALLDTAERDAFHLELRDSYNVAYEEGPFDQWLRGEPDDHAWLEDWLDRMRAITKTGRTVRRVRVITEPISEYIRWEYETTHLNQGAGEDIRWLPRHHVPHGFVAPVSGNDWWLIDDRLLTVGHFDDDGRSLGSEVIADPATVAACVRVRDQLWTLAIPHDAYTPR